jgi:hypothetical protein
MSKKKVKVIELPPDAFELLTSMLDTLFSPPVVDEATYVKDMKEALMQSISVLGYVVAASNHQFDVGHVFDGITYRKTVIPQPFIITGQATREEAVKCWELMEGGHNLPEAKYYYKVVTE